MIERPPVGPVNLRLMLPSYISRRLRATRDRNKALRQAREVRQYVVDDGWTGPDWKQDAAPVVFHKFTDEQRTEHKRRLTSLVASARYHNRCRVQAITWIKLLGGK
jgi:hypothetical protein